MDTLDNIVEFISILAINFELAFFLTKTISIFSKKSDYHSYYNFNMKSTSKKIIFLSIYNKAKALCGLILLMIIALDILI